MGCIGDNSSVVFSIWEQICGVVGGDSGVEGPGCDCGVDVLCRESGDRGVDDPGI